MRIRVIVLSIVSAVAVVFLGSLLNFLGWFCFDYALPYNDPIVILATLVGVAPGFIVGLIGLWFAVTDARRRGGSGWLNGLLVWLFVPILAAGLMFAGVLAHTTSWFLALAFVPLGPLVYAIVAPVSPHLQAPLDPDLPRSWALSSSSRLEAPRCYIPAFKAAAPCHPQRCR